MKADLRQTLTILYRGQMAGVTHEPATQSPSFCSIPKRGRLTFEEGFGVHLGSHTRHLLNGIGSRARNTSDQRWFRGRVSGSRHDSTKDLPCIRAWSMLNLLSVKHPPAGGVRNYGEGADSGVVFVI
ncbi:hypothetical protein AVEN_256892-1 [Araneus ventricosus]|uniref:Uncharacterized protein n=1 Tax=Araneus ventricosus TaxID=182803 RepID=A0A4Y2CHI0_ARAVE|nr:hypothetical protein AVEN_256892-1 [Araneus ventricosus]